MKPAECPRRNIDQISIVAAGIFRLPPVHAVGWDAMGWGRVRVQFNPVENSDRVTGFMRMVSGGRAVDAVADAPRLGAETVALTHASSRSRVRTTIHTPNEIAVDSSRCRLSRLLRVVPPIFRCRSVAFSGRRAGTDST